MTNDDIVRVIEGAFAPYLCKAQVRSNGLVLFKVKHDTPTLFVETGFMLASLRNDERRLAAMVTALRERIQRAGYQLNSWP